MLRLKRIVPVLVALLTAMMACNLPLGSVSRQDATMTAAVKTIIIEMTSTAMALTLVPPGALSTPTPLNFTPPPPATTQTPATRCNWGEFISDVSVVDGTTFAPGTPFTKTWRLRNIGTCAWTSDYAVIFDSGSSMGAPASVPMPRAVSPGDTVDISVNMVAPQATGRQTGYWKLRDASGTPFGLGENGQGTFYVQIEVK